MSYNTSSAAIGALFLVPIAIVIGVTFGAIRLSEIGGARWEQFQSWRRSRRRTRSRKNSDLTSGQSDNPRDSSTARGSGQSSWDESFASPV